MTASADAFARRRNAARLAAVQALYQMELSGRGASAVVREFIHDRLREEGDVAEELDADFLAELVEAVVAEQATIDARVSEVLAEGWKLSRLDATARAILRAGAAEILTFSGIPAAVAIDAYVGIAHAFFDGPEPAFVNAALDALAKRAEERAAARS